LKKAFDMLRPADYLGTMPVALQPPPAPHSAGPVGPAVQPLENGDRLTAREFLRRYDAMPQVKKAELIEGIKKYRPNPPDPQGLIHSRAFPGLTLDVAALLALDTAKVMDALEADLRGPAHAAFVARLSDLSKP